jgi:branched-chain amino acid transport system permease protein
LDASDRRGSGVPAPRGRSWGRAALVVGALIALAYPIPLQLQGYTYFQTVGFLVFLNAMLGVGWNIIGGWTGQFDFGPQVFLATGAYTAAILFVHLEWNAWVTMIAAVLVSVVICALLTYPITKLRGHYFAIATVAIWMIAQPIGATWEFINGSRGLFIPMRTGQGWLAGLASLQFAGRIKGLGYYYVALGMFALILWLARAVQHSKLGYYFRAIRDDQEGAESIGIDIRLYKVVARCLTAAVFAVGGVLYGFWALAVFPEQVLELNWSTLPMMATVVGGIGYLWGPVLGAFILIPISQIMSTTLGTGPLAGRGVDLIVYGLIIIVIAALRPTGILSLPWSQWARRFVSAEPTHRRPAPEDAGSRG